MLVIGILLLINNVQSSPILIDLGQTIGIPANIDSEYDRLIGQINLYNLNHNPDLTYPDSKVGESFTPYTSSLTTLGLTFDPPFNGYFMFKWGNRDHFYYAENLDEYTFVSTVFNPNSKLPLGLSHWDQWSISPTTVPDSGATAIFLGCSLVGIVVLKKKCLLV